MSSTKQYICKSTAKNTDDGMLQLLVLKFPYHQIAIRLKKVNHEKFESVH